MAAGLTHFGCEIGDDNKYWLAWCHRKAIKLAVANRSYDTVVYMEDDTRLTWPVLVSWAIDTQLLAEHNYSRCIYRTEVDKTAGFIRLMDYEHGIDTCVRARVDVASSAAYTTLAQRLQGKACGRLPNGTAMPCRMHRHFVSPSFPFQGMWIATKPQLQRFMSLPMWDKQGALQAGPWGDNMTAKMRRPRDNWGWGYPERSASIAIHGGLVETRRKRRSARGRKEMTTSCMVPYSPGTLNAPARLAPLARVEHLRNAYSNWGNIRLEHGIANANCRR